MIKKKFDGKTLLVLGSNVGAVDIISYAKANGAHTIAADYYPPEKSAAKRIADEHVLISTADLEALGALIEEKHVNGVLSGISEFNLLKAMELSEKYDLPFYCTREQWHKIERKNEFRALCEEYKVPCPRTYYTGGEIPEDIWETFSYPAVLKPVDASTSAGVFICYSEEEMRIHEQESISKSESGKIIVEEFVAGDEFTAHYTIADGRVSLACVDNRYPVAVHEGTVTTIPVARVYPCLYIDEYIKQVNPAMLNLCKGLGVKDAILFIQGMYDEETNSFHVFEAGLRSAGEAPYRFISRINGVNAMQVLVDHALSVDSDFASEQEDPFMKGKCCGIISFVARGGKVGSIIGLEETVRAVSSVVEYESRYPVGSTTPDGDTLRQLMIRFVMICDSRDRMAEDIAYLNEHITALDENGSNMVIKMLPERLYGTK